MAKESKEDKEMREDAEEQTEKDIKAKAIHDAEQHDVNPESVIGQRPVRVLLEYADGHVVQIDGDNIVDYQGLSPAGSDPYAGVLQLRLKTSTAQYRRRVMKDFVS